MGKVTFTFPHDVVVSEYERHKFTIVPGAKGEKGDDGAPGRDGADGAPGRDGTDGYTPQRGVDYWTAADVAAVTTAAVEAVKPMIAVFAAYDTVGPADVAATEYGLGGLPMKSVVVDIVPMQGGSGDPSPTNVRPISGCTSVSVVVSPSSDPSDGTTYTTAIPTPPGTVYGGTLDLVSGALVVTHGYKLLSDPDTWTQNAWTGSGFSCSDRASDRKKFDDSYTGTVCSCAGGSSSAVRARWLSASDTRFGIQDTTGTLTLERVKAMASNGDIAISYPLATPISYQCDPQTIAALAGTNVLTSGAGKVTARIPIDLKAYVDDRLAGN